MGCVFCCCKKKPSDEPEFTEAKDRKCTDVLCLLLFVLFWGGMAAIAVVGFKQVRRAAVFEQSLRCRVGWHDAAPSPNPHLATLPHPARVLLPFAAGVGRRVAIWPPVVNKGGGVGR
jgi:hypothetical protein